MREVPSFWRVHVETIQRSLREGIWWWSGRARKRATRSGTEDVRVAIQDSVERRIVKFAGSSDLNASGLGGRIVDVDQAEGSLHLRSRQMALKS
jgi:hypothetical protein